PPVDIGTNPVWNVAFPTPAGSPRRAAMATTRRSRDTNGHTPITNDTMRKVEALSVGAVNVLTGTVVSALRGMQEIGTEVGSAAATPVCGAIRAAEVRAGDVGRAARTMRGGAAVAGRDVGGDVARTARDAADGALDAADRIGSATLRLVRGVMDEAVTRANVGGRKALQKSEAAPVARAARSRRRVA